MRQRKPKPGGRQLNLFSVIVLAMFAYFIYVCVGQQLELNAINQEKAAHQNRLNQLMQTKAELKDERDRLNTPAYIEKIAREELGLVKPGEVPYIPSDKSGLSKTD